VIKAPLWDVAALGPAAYPSNAAFVQQSTANLLTTSFPNLRPQQVEVRAKRGYWGSNGWGLQVWWWWGGRVGCRGRRGGKEWLGMACCGSCLFTACQY
jgi:hypothetical protein